MTFGEKLKKIRLERVMSQDDMAALLETSKQVISRYENGQRIPKITVVNCYAEKLNLSLEYLLDDDIENPNFEGLAQGARDVFSQNFKKYLELSDKNQSDVADALGVTASTVSDWVNAKKYPRVDKMQLLADFLSVSISQLRDEESDGITKKLDDFQFTLYNETKGVSDATKKSILDFIKFAKTQEEQNK